jgi:tRNA G18 (ribose-2'-O)-methylase SpoU
MSRIHTQGVCFRDIISETNQDFDNGLNVHGHLKNKTIEELRAIQQDDTLPYEVMFFNLTGDLNIGSMTRSACVSGAQKVWIFGRRKFDRRGLVGCNNYINIEQVNGFVGDTIDFDAEKLISLLENKRLVPIYAEHGGYELGRFSWREKIAPITKSLYTPLIVMGNENSGYPAHIVEVFKQIEHSFCVTIPQRGVMRSFNVGHALSAILWDMRRDMGWF